MGSPSWLQREIPVSGRIADARSPEPPATDLRPRLPLSRLRGRGSRHGRPGGAMSELHRIMVNPEQSGGRPSIRGLRVRVKDVLELLAAGVGREEILADYPY